jgi:hypothetical protein
MTCTAAAILALLGYMPPEGTVITIPRSMVAKYTTLQLTKARICARRHGIKWQIAEDK